MSSATDSGESQTLSFWETYYADEVTALAQRYPEEQRHITIDWGDLLRFDPDIADDYLVAPDRMTDLLRDGLAEFPLPAGISLTPEAIRDDIDIRVVGLHDADIYSPMEIIRDADSREQAYIGVRGELAKVTEPKKEAQQVAFECVRCGVTTTVPQTGDDFQEPHECVGCERQGPFNVLPDHEQTTFAHHVKVRTETPPDQRGELQNESIDGEVRGDADLRGDVEDLFAQGDIALTGSVLQRLRTPITTHLGGDVGHIVHGQRLHVGHATGQRDHFRPAGHREQRPDRRCRKVLGAGGVGVDPRVQPGALDARARLTHRDSSPAPVFGEGLSVAAWHLGRPVWRPTIGQHRR